MCEPHPHNEGSENLFSGRYYLYITAKKFIPLKESHSRDISIKLTNFFM